MKDALRRQYHREDRQWRVRSDLYALTQTGTLTQYFDSQELLCNHLIHGLKTHLKEALVLQQPGDYNTAVSFAELKESTTQTNYDEILKKLGKELQNQQINSSAQVVNNVEYIDPVRMSIE